jgi:hypothetical protein
MYVVWNRVQSRLASFDGKPGDRTYAAPPPVPTEPAAPSAEDTAGAWAFGGVTEQAARLKKKGCSLEQIAQQLQLPTREVEMVLAIAEMAAAEKPGKGMHIPFPLEPGAVRTV